MVDEIRKRPKPRSGLYYCRFDGEIDTLLTDLYQTTFGRTGTDETKYLSILHKRKSIAVKFHIFCV